MSNIFAKRGFNAVKEEEVRREKVKELKKGKLFRFFVPKGLKDIPVTFLTEEPINFWEHTVPQAGGRFLTVPCIGEGCNHCESGKPSFKSAWLIIDHTSYSYKDQAGKEVTGKDRIKLLVRGMTDAAILENKSAKFGLMKYDWTVTKVGTGTSSSLQFERGERLALTAKQIDAIMSQLSEQLRGLDPYDIVEMQIMGDLEVGNSSTPAKEEDISADVEEKVLSGVQDIEDDEDSDGEDVVVPTKAKGKLPRKTVK